MASRREPSSHLPWSGIRAMTRTRHGTRTSSLHAPLAASRFNRDGAIAPAESVSSIATTGTKRKDREYDSDAGVAVSEETSINVVVRCRGRNEREVKENSAVVVQADSVKGKLIQLSIGPSSLSNKTYNFDRVFSPAADQSMIYDEVVKPILDEMLAGYNCTIFAYGQTGTGKTYTMSGNMTPTLGLLSDDAGIIPRVLHALFNKLEIDDNENCVKCSFIELYNEELRDLLSVEENVRLKIYDDTSRKGHAATIVQGMEEKHIKTAGEGIKVLQDGSLKRQVAATKCNDLSSRSHTVFTITAYVRKKGEKDYINAGKLHLVDLAGSENIQRSGAESKRAAEAGLINKSLLTLGRVINALVDRSQHIPYRESKLTRLLQDSLGGQTKTCIIATISPAKSNIEETISTLDYAFRAKNIRNKPQLNAPINKQILLRDFTTKIEQLKSELIATRQRNGVYLSNELYEEIIAESESRRIVLDEQTAKIETLETNLKNKVQELFHRTSTFLGLKKDHESTKSQLDETRGALDQTELALNAIQKALTREMHLRKAHQATEEELTKVGGELINTLHRTVHDVDGLHAKSKRESNLQAINVCAWRTTQGQVADIIALVEQRIEEFQSEQEKQIASSSKRMQQFVAEELDKLSSTQTFWDQQLQRFAESRRELFDQKEKSKNEIDDMLEEIKVVRDTVKEQVSESLQTIAPAAEKIAADLLRELGTFHNQLHNSHSALGKDFRGIFEDLTTQITQQRDQSDRLRQQLQTAIRAIAEQNVETTNRMKQAMEEERKQAAEDRQYLLFQMTTLVNSQSEKQETRLAHQMAQLQKSLLDSNVSLQVCVAQHGDGMDVWNEKQNGLLDQVAKSRDTMKTKLKDDWNAANDHSMSIQATAKSVNAETMRVVEEQVQDLNVQMEALNDFVTLAHSENASHHERHTKSVQSLSAIVEQSLDNISFPLKTTFQRVEGLGSEMETRGAEAQQRLEPLGEDLFGLLGDLREKIMATSIKEYQPTGDTPRKVQYQFPTDLPRTQAHARVLVDLDDIPASPTKSEGPPPTVLPDILDAPNFARSPSRGVAGRASIISSSSLAIMPEKHVHTISNPFSMSLREVNTNLTTNFATTGSLPFDPIAGGSVTKPLDAMAENNPETLFKRTSSSLKGKAGGLKTQGGLLRVSLEGRENVPLPPTAFSQSLGPRRKSPRLH